MELVDRLKTLGVSCGLAGIGVCDVGPFSEVREELEARISAGTHGSMRFTFSDPATSTDVRRSFGWAERLVVGAWSYLPEAGSPGPSRPGSGRIARFATEDHYRGLRVALQAVGDELARAGWRSAILVDDNRLVDRAAAVRAGVTWWGKNSMALAPGAGPWLLLGSVVTDAPLGISEPMRRDCGTCSACLGACPTGALVAPGVLDARLCLAHWAQAPGVFPRELREAMGDRVYGCDDCLEVCPPGSRLLKAAAVGAGRVDLVEILRTDDRALLDRFAHFYVPRRQARFVRRNALIALGNVGGPGAGGILAGFATHPDPMLRAHAVWALDRLGGPAERAALEAVDRRERDPLVRAELEALSGSHRGTVPGC